MENCAAKKQKRHLPIHRNALRWMAEEMWNFLRIALNMISCRCQSGALVFGTNKRIALRLSAINSVAIVCCWCLTCSISTPDQKTSSASNWMDSVYFAFAVNAVRQLWSCASILRFFACLHFTDFEWMKLKSLKIVVSIRWELVCLHEHTTSSALATNSIFLCHALHYYTEFGIGLNASPLVAHQSHMIRRSIDDATNDTRRN